ncbi:LacI family DNA-binding transcriptional regulator [Curtobacterium sp. MCBD17_040]|uniref:LacI family DNA-binding transcriptional regulator n=1 Tax=Curtobacterium sp. MCBD17_040 TaxID=2175674 RepID=UPI000DA85BBC|nr:LacI family DNA-binding transcriptional regulator [Curtobacterium sp. MCBD17_040]WIB63071.1 LacI family DNA-binding transcriptional regulator [Curtobacterium sp. MCBD17_040]
MRPTVRDVAALAGVSPKTVSNVINGGVPVRPDTRQRVEAALAELDYVPNLSARGLRNGRSGTIALALPDLGTSYSAELARAFVELARGHGWAVQIDQTGSDPAREIDLISRARAHLVDGLVLNPVTLGESVVANGRGLPPTVVIGEVEPQDMDQVHVDSFAAGRDVGRLLIATGHRRIVLLGTSDDSFRTASSETRHEGHRAALREAGLREDPTLSIAVGSWSTSAAAAAMSRFLDQHGSPDAVFCFTDSMALGVLHVLADRGVRVPEDVSVVGFDDIEEASFAVPSLTTVSFDKRAIAEAALTALERRIEDPDAPRIVQVVPHHIVERASVAPRRG